MHIDINLINDILAKNIHDLQCAFAHLNFVSELDEENVTFGETESMENLISIMVPEFMKDERGDEHTLLNKIRAFDCACQMLVANLKNPDNGYPEEFTSPANSDYDESEDEEEAVEINATQFATYVFNSYQEQLKIFNKLTNTLAPKAVTKHKM